MKPTTIAGYNAESTSAARATVLTLATWLGDLMDDVVIVGGLVPSLLVGEPPDGVEPHAGTLDVDLALHLAVLDDQRYAKISERLRRAGAAPSKNDEGKPTPQKWCVPVGTASVEIDFLIGPATPTSRPGGIQHLEADFAAYIIPAVPLAFADRRRCALSGNTLSGEAAQREVWVAGPGSFVVMKALALKMRGERKDAYDLCWILQAWENGPADVAAVFSGLPAHPLKDEALAVLVADFDTAEPRRRPARRRVHLWRGHHQRRSSKRLRRHRRGLPTSRAVGRRDAKQGSRRSIARGRKSGRAPQFQPALAAPDRHARPAGRRSQISTLRTSRISTIVPPWAESSSLNPRTR